MFKNVLALILSSIFILVVVMPTVIIALDDSVDVSIFYNNSEEEKDNTQEKNIDKEFIFTLVNTSLKINGKDLEELSLHYYSRTYNKPHIELSFPPPKIVFTII
ncbi:hypothetical protein [uncultured Algibacter sp.]|uniref:hypothetical protein n=1 Tax=uncultured Algibacter sp. TaxID=298659 RepID=UPI00261DA0D9|nr:hypothetical protein [uncultured Algibacter sp.]